MKKIVRTVVDYEMHANSMCGESGFEANKKTELVSATKIVFDSENIWFFSSKLWIFICQRS